MKYPNDLDRWIVMYLQGRLNEEDRIKLQSWRSASLENEALFQQLCSEPLWRQGIKEMASYDEEKGWEEVLEKSRAKKGRSLWKKWYGVAAAILVLLGTGMLAWWSMPKSVDVPVTAEVKNVVRLNVATGRSFLLDSVRHIETGRTMMKNTGKQLVVKPITTEKKEIEWNTIEVPRGTEYSLMLSDGTEIYLNAETILRFPDQFREEGNREVWIKGEAYFKVARDAGHPFVVHTGSASVQVLGTVFNVMAYENMPELQVTLISGKVEVEANTGRQTVVLVPGEQAVYNKQQKTLCGKTVDVSYYTAWHEGMFAFRETPLSQVMETLSRWYDFEVFFQNQQARDFVYTGKIKRHATLKEVLENFRQMGEFDFVISGKTVIIK